MTTPLFIGDEVTAAAYRLAGLRTRVPDKGTVAEIFEAALDDAALVLITANCAAELPTGRIAGAMRLAEPLVLIVPDAANQVAPPDLGREVDHVLGIDA